MLGQMRLLMQQSLLKKGKVISLALNFDYKGPQGAKTKYPAMGRTNPIHSMLRTGTDAYSGVLDQRGIRAADDTVFLPTHGCTHWDGLGHVSSMKTKCGMVMIAGRSLPQERRSVALKKQETKWLEEEFIRCC